MILNLESHFIASLFEGIFIFDAQEKLLRINTSGERIIGRSEKATAGVTADDLFPKNPELAELVRTSLTENRALVHSGIDYNDPGGKPLHLSVSTSPIQEPDGTVIGAALVVRDETLLKEIDRSQRRADQLATLGIMNLGMAHEIKNPLGGIKGAAQLLRSDLEEGSPLIEYSDVILREVDRIDSLLEGLLSAQPRREVHYEELNIHEVLNEVIHLLEMSDETSCLTFTKSFDPSLPPIKGDRNGLTQVFLNLFKNAVEASPPGGEVIIRTLVPVGTPRGQMPFSRTRQKGGVLEVDVIDQGQGFDPAAGDFPAPFFTTKTKGVGLGLAITEQIIRNHEGALLLENREEGGAVVRVYLPLGSGKGEVE